MAFNRTYIELKQHDQQRCKYADAPFNRTYIELKLDSTKQSSLSCHVFLYPNCSSFCATRLSVGCFCTIRSSELLPKCNLCTLEAVLHLYLHFGGLALHHPIPHICSYLLRFMFAPCGTKLQRFLWPNVPCPQGRNIWWAYHHASPLPFAIYFLLHELLFVNDTTIGINGTPMDDVASIGRNADSAFSYFASICFVWYSISLVINLSQSILYCIINFQFEYEDVCLGLDNHIGTSEDALDFGIDLAVKEREYCIDDEFVECLTLPGSLLERIRE